MTNKQKVKKVDALVASGMTKTEACKKSKIGLSTYRYHKTKEAGTLKVYNVGKAKKLKATTRKIGTMGIVSALVERVSQKTLKAVIKELAQ